MELWNCEAEISEENRFLMVKILLTETTNDTECFRSFSTYLPLSFFENWLWKHRHWIFFVLHHEIFIVEYTIKKIFDTRL